MSRIHTPLTDELADYIRQIALREPDVLRQQREATDLHPRASMQTSPEQGQFLHLLTRLAGARKTLEAPIRMDSRYNSRISLGNASSPVPWSILFRPFW